jgi:hypothetical protein
MDAQYVGARLAEAGRTLMALPSKPHRQGLVLSSLIAAQQAHQSARLTIVPPPRDIDRMHVALNWLGLIPDEKSVLRKILMARALCNPVTGLPLYSWHKIATLCNTDHRAVQRWHAEALRLLARKVESTFGRVAA